MHNIEWLNQLQQRLDQDKHRGLVVVQENDLATALSRIQPLITTTSSTFFLSTEQHSPDETLFPPECWHQITPAKARHFLGQECEQLIINGFERLKPEAIGALSGTLKAGGICWLLCHELASEQFIHSQAITNESFSGFASHWRHILRTEQQAIILTRGDLLSGNHADIPGKVKQQAETGQYTTQYEEQQHAINDIIKVATGHRNRPLVLTADRGRGKTSALGLAAASLIKHHGKQRVLVTAPRRAMVDPLFTHFETSFPPDTLQIENNRILLIDRNAELINNGAELIYIAPDSLIDDQHLTADIVLVDEAAAIPAPMLSSLLKRFSRLVFSSTIHGYEGTGRGFELRFKARLERNFPGWKSRHLNQPVRWHDDDPLEQIINRLLLLNTSVSTPPENLSSAQTQQIAIKSLVQQPELLQQIVGLLTLAHYKTSPDDVQHLLDDPSIRLFIQTQQDEHAKSWLTGCALIALEGKLSGNLSDAIWRGERRIPGHLIPQSLSQHLSDQQAPTRRYARVMRIAIHPALHRRGSGTALLNEVESLLLQSPDKPDFFASTFGATSALLNFWQACGYHPVKLGLHREATSSEYAALVLKPVSDNAIKIMTTYLTDFTAQLWFQLPRKYPSLAPELIVNLIKAGAAEQAKHEAELTDKALRQLVQFTTHHLDFQWVIRLIPALILRTILCDRVSKYSDEVNLLIAAAIQGRDDKLLISDFGLQGKKALTSALKKAVERLLSDDE